MNANELGGLMAEIIFRTDDKQTSEVLKALDSIKLGSDVQGDLKKIRWEIINEAIYYKSGAMYYMIQKVCQEQNSSDGIYLQQAYMDVLVHICDNSDPEKIYWLNSDILKERTATYMAFGPLLMQDELLKTVKGILDKYDFISEKDKAIVCNGFIKFSDYGKLIDSLQQSVAVAQKTGKVKASAGAGCLIPILVIIALFMVLR